MSLKEHLVLARFFLSKLQVDSIGKLSNWQSLEGTQATGMQTVFFNAALGMASPDLAERLPLYDANLREYESRLAQRRRDFVGFKYFQYVALLASEYHLDRLTREPESYLADLNRFGHPELKSTHFTPSDLRHLAFYLATGAGKTLLLHVHYWQILHYLQDGNAKEALAPEGRFGNILLLAPNSGLAEQHLRELERSGIPARHLTEVKQNSGSVPPGTVLVVDMPKLRNKRAKDEAETQGVYYPNLGQTNLVFADEGHKGTAQLEKGWRQIREWLSEKGLLLEYSATFAQVLKDEEIKKEYGKRILVDYQYRYFYQDGYGKDFYPIEANPGNLNPSAEEEATLMGSLLLYYVQLRHYLSLGDRVREYNLEKPLWTFVGHTVVKSNAGKEDEIKEDAQTLSDVIRVVAFLKRLTEEPEWAQNLIRDAVRNKNFIGETNPFAPHLTALQAEVDNPQQLYQDLLEKVMLGRGALELRLMPAQGEIGLKIAGTQGYFGVIHIGDTAGFKRELKAKLELVVGEDRFYNSSLFQEIHRPNSSINVLIGSRKFVEGWSSWRVSTLTLLNIGKNQGPLIIQLFGRGVRLLGKGGSLKRSREDEVRPLEILYVVGLRANYMQSFLEAIRREGGDLERIHLELRVNQALLAKPLPLPRLPQDFDFEAHTVVLKPNHHIEPHVVLAARISMPEEGKEQNKKNEKEIKILVAGRRYVLQPWQLTMLDWVSLRHKLLTYARAERLGNLSFSMEEMREVLQKGFYNLTASEKDLSNPQAIEQAALAILRKYLSEYHRRTLNDAQAQAMLPDKLRREDLKTHYEVTVPKSLDILKRIIQLSQNLSQWQSEQVAPIPRLYIDPSIGIEVVSQPLVYEAKNAPLPEGVEVSPAPLKESEFDFVRSLRDFWKANNNKPEFVSLRLYLMRNNSQKSLGFHNKTGFYPDFVLWVEYPNGSWRVVFVEPHGLGREYIVDHPKLEVFTQLLPQLSTRPDFQQMRITLDGYMLTPTPASQIPGSEVYNSDWNLMAEKTHLLVRERGEDINMRTIILGI